MNSMDGFERLLLGVLTQRAEDYILAVKVLGVNFATEILKKYPRPRSRHSGLSYYQYQIWRHGLQAHEYFFKSDNDESATSFNFITDHFEINKTRILNVLRNLTQDGAEAIVKATGGS